MAVIELTKIMDIIELGHKPDGNSFYSNEEKAELLQLLFDEEANLVFDRGWRVGYDRGVIDGQTPSGW